MGLQETIERHSWRFNDDDDEELQSLHSDFIVFMNKNCKRIEHIENKYGRKFHLPYFTKRKKGELTNGE